MTGKRDIARNALMEKGNMAENDAYLRKVNIRDDLSVNLSGNANKQKCENAWRPDPDPPHLR